MKPVVVTGTGRSGTKYMAALLGITHERKWNQNGQIAELGSDSAAFAAPFLPIDAYVIHVVRDPWTCIPSLAAGHIFRMARSRRWGPIDKSPYYRFIRSHAPDVFDHPDAVSRAAAFYATWNLMIEPHADERIQVEAISPADCRRWERLTGDDGISARLRTLPHNMNTRPRERKPRIDRLPDEVLEMGRRYGYASCE